MTVCLVLFFVTVVMFDYYLNYKRENKTTTRITEWEIKEKQRKERKRVENGGKKNKKKELLTN